MIATINRDGVLCVSAESEFEAYALIKWGQENCKEGESTKLLIKTVCEKGSDE